MLLYKPQVQLEAAEIQRAQSIAGASQQNLEDSANNVRVITAALRTAQETVANAALRAQTAQLQLAAHDQLLFTARQKVDALSAQMVGLQAEVGITGDNKMTVDLPALLHRLKEPLRPDEQPKPIQSIVGGMDAGQLEMAGGDPMHQFKAHSADPNYVVLKFEQPAQKRSIASDPNAKTALTTDDINELLTWIHQAKSEAIGGTSDNQYSGSSAAAGQNNQQYVDSFISNMKNLNFQTKAPSENDSDLYKGSSAYDWLGKTYADDGSNMARYGAKSNAEIIDESLRAVDNRNQRDAGTT